MRKYIYLPLLLLLLCQASAYGQFEREIAVIKEHSKQFMGQWGIANDTLVFTVEISPYSRQYEGHESKPTYEGFIGRFWCSYIHGGDTIKSEGEVKDMYCVTCPAFYSLQKANPNRAVFHFLDKIMGKGTGGSIRVEGDTLFWSLSGSDRIHLVDEHGKPTGYVPPIDKYSIPRRMKLIRIKP